MGCVQSKGPDPKSEKENQRKQDQLERKKKYQTEKLQESIQYATDKVYSRNSDLTDSERHDWGLLDAQIHQEQHLKCHDTTITNNINAGQNLIELCRDQIQDLEELLEKDLPDIQDVVSAPDSELNRVISEIKSIHSSTKTKVKDYVVYWVSKVEVPDRIRYRLIDYLCDNYPDEYPESDRASWSNINDLFEKHQEHIKQCDSGVHDTWRAYCKERDVALTELFSRINQRCDELKDGFEDWKTNLKEGHHNQVVEITSSDTIHHKVPVDIVDDKRDRNSFPQTDSQTGEEYYCDWSSQLQSEFAKLEAEVVAICKKIYIKHYPATGAFESDPNMTAQMLVKLSPCTNIGIIALGNSDGPNIPNSSNVNDSDNINSNLNLIKLQRSYYVEFTAEENRLDNGDFKNDEERLDYMRSFNKPVVATRIGMNRKFKRNFTDYYAKKVKVEGLCRRCDVSKGKEGLNLVIFPGGSCLSILGEGGDSGPGPEAGLNFVAQTSASGNNKSGTTNNESSKSKTKSSKSSSESSTDNTV